MQNVFLFKKLKPFKNLFLLFHLPTCYSPFPFQRKRKVLLSIIKKAGGEYSTCQWVAKILLAKHLQQPLTSVSFLTCHASLIATLHKLSLSSHRRLQFCVFEEAASGANISSQHEAAQADRRSADYPGEAEALIPWQPAGHLKHGGSEAGRPQPAAAGPQTAYSPGPRVPRLCSTLPAAVPRQRTDALHPSIPPSAPRRGASRAPSPPPASHRCECGGLLPVRGSHLSRKGGWGLAGRQPIAGLGGQVEWPLVGRQEGEGEGPERAAVASERRRSGARRRSVPAGEDAAALGCLRLLLPTGGGPGGCAVPPRFFPGGRQVPASQRGPRGPSRRTVPSRPR